jgi:hypothetical protein
VEYKGFHYGSHYPMPQYVDAKCVKADADSARARQVDAQLAADSMAGLNLNDPPPSSLLSASTSSSGGGGRQVHDWAKTQDVGNTMPTVPAASTRATTTGRAASGGGKKKLWKVGGLDHLR